MRKPEQRYDLTPSPEGKTIVARLLRRGFSAAMIAFTLGVSRQRAHTLIETTRWKQRANKRKEQNE